MGARGVLRTGEGGRLLFYCPGCNEMHQVQTGDGPGPRWGFNGDYDRPTFTPSILIRVGHYVPGHENGPCWCTYAKEHPEDDHGFKCSVCHSFVRDGQIQFLDDCTHALAGQTVPLQPIVEGGSEK